MSDKIKATKTAKPEKPIEVQTTLVLPDSLPVIASGSTVLYPQQLVPIVATEERDVKAIDEAASSEEKMLAVLPQEMVDGGKYEGGLREVGATATIVRMAKAPDGSIHAILQGLGRVRLVELAEDKPWLRAKVEAVVETGERNAEAEAMTRDVLKTFAEVVDMSDSMPADLKSAAESMSDTSTLSDFVAGNLQLKPEERYQVLVELDVNKRLSMVRDLLAHEVDVSKVQSKIQSEVQGELDKRQREFILREQMKAIQRELGEGEITPELSELKERLGEANLSEAAQREADRELQRLSTIPSMSPEYQVARTYLEWLADLPWSTSTDYELDIKRAEKILDEDHFGLDKVKRRILDFLAVLKLKEGDTRGPILCFVGPPGTGKTSLGQSVARALGRNFIRVALGGIRDEAEIRAGPHHPRDQARGLEQPGADARRG
jgi:ATP-dependent Lon protease